MSKSNKSKSHSSKAHSSKAHSSKAHNRKPERGWVLTGAIILVGISGLISFLTILGEKGFQTADIPTWFIVAAIGAAIADIVAAFGLWGWKKWAYYLYLASTVVSIVLGLMATGSMLFAFSRIIPFAIVGYIIMPKWKYFD